MMEREEQIPSSGASKTPVVSFRPAGRRRAASDGGGGHGNWKRGDETCAAQWALRPPFVADDMGHGL